MVQLNSTAVLSITLPFAPDIRLCHFFHIFLFMVLQYSEFVFNKWLSSVNIFILTVRNSISQANIFMYIYIYTNCNICNLFRGKGVDILDTLK